jgi:plastocyanin
MMACRFALALLMALVTGPTHAADAFVTIDNFTFKPAILVITPGTKVTFKNEDDIPHSVVATDGHFHAPAMDTGDSYSITFATPGTFPYFCGLHPHMQGRIIVKP